MIKTLYKPFQHWSDGGRVFLLSDLHLDDEDCKCMDANWIAPEEQIEIINKTVGKKDTFVCLGDVGDPKYIPMIRAQRKILLLGNHDIQSKYKECFDEIYKGCLFISDKILLSHEPVFGLPWCLNIHGHDHSGLHSIRSDGSHGINIVANLVNYTPINLGEIIRHGFLSDISTIHRITIDRAVEQKKGDVGDKRS